MDRNKLHLIIACLVAAVLLFGAGWFTRDWWGSQHDRKHDRRVMAQGARFTSPLLDVELPEGVNISHEPIPIKHKVRAAVQDLIKKGQAKEVAVYYRDLHDGPWIGINENMLFDPASMMKVPVMIAWLKRAETNPRELKRMFTYDGRMDMSSVQETRPKRTLAPGRSYSVEELLHYMIYYSDNNATTLLYSGLDTTELNAVLDGMDIDNRPDEFGNNITIHGYSGFFRILYNASFLNREMSEKALSLLSLQDYPQGITAGVPKGIPVASKFGETSRGPQNNDKQLHEFGIVYHPQHPYILGIMTRGSDSSKLPGVLESISRMIYKEVDADAAKAGDRQATAQ